MLSPCLRRFLETRSAGLEHSGLSRELLPSLHRDVGITWIDFHGETESADRFCSHDRRPAAGEGLIHVLARLGMVENRPAHERHRFLCRVVELFFIRAAHDELRRWREPDRGVLTGFTKPWS